MLLQEPVQAAIWDALNLYDYADATFLAERLFAEVSSPEAQFLLATCYYRAGKPIKAYMLLQKAGCPTPKCKYLMARCCMDINKYSEAESVLAGNILSKTRSSDEIESEFGNMAGQVFALLGAMYSKTERPQKAAECYRRSLKLNPFLWSSFERLCQLGEKVDPTAIFHIPNQGQTNTVVQTNKNNVQQQNVHVPVSDVLTPITEVTQTQSTGETKLQTPAPPSIVTSEGTPEGGNTQPGDITAAPQRTTRHRTQPRVVGRGLLSQPLFLSPITPTFGILPLETPSPNDCHHSIPFVTPSPNAFGETNTLDVKAPSKKPATRRGQNQNQNPLPKPPVFSQSGNTNSQLGSQNNPPTVRRSSRLFGNSSSVKENNKSQSKTRFTSPKAVGRKSKTRSSKSQQEMNEINKGEIIIDSKPPPVNDGSAQIAQMQQQSLVGLLSLLQSIGKAYQALAQYDSIKAIESFQDLPEHQYTTGWVLCQLGRAYFELAEYQKAERVFSQVRLCEPYHMDGMEIYSTTLWHLQKEVELSTLAHELVEMDQKAPEAWCATGNCFSLQKEHDTAIKFFQRAIQVDPDFAYAYTLLGHEYVFTEELDKAMACFRNAIRVDPRHYNAWYGVGMIYHKQEKFSLAEVHFRKALLINPRSSVLLCHIGVVQHAQQKSDSALMTLSKAISADPMNPLCKFHRASILFANDKHKEALEELEKLKQIVPKESLVYFLIGKVHKKLGDTHLALMNFSWAMDLDPKGINNQIKEAIDKRYVTEDEDSVGLLNEVGAEDLPVGGSNSNSSLMDPDDMQLQANESDESL